MTVLFALLTLLSLAAAAPQSSSASLRYPPLPSSLSNPTNLSSAYYSANQAPKPLVQQATGLNNSINPDHVLNTTRPVHPDVVPQASCNGPTAGSPSIYWREKIAHNGKAATLNDNSFTVWRNVVSDYGADNSGNNDASGAINNAIGAGNRYGNGFTTRPAYVYVPGGTYKISDQVNLLVNTFLVGDPLNMPVFVADPSLGTKPVIQGFDNSKQSTTNFYTALRNLKIDTTRLSTSTKAVGLNWAVSQGCSLFNVIFQMPNYSSHIGITMLAYDKDGKDEGGGSGTLISDCTFNGGAIGIQVNNQQYMLKGLTFNGCNVGIYIRHIFVATIQGATFMNCNYGIDMSNSYNVGSVSLIDSAISSCSAGIYTAVTGNGEGSIVIDNLNVGSGVTTVKSNKGDTLLSGSVSSGQTWVMGNENPQNYQSGKMYQINRPSALISGGKYYTKKQPQYEKYEVNQFVNVKSAAGYTVYGDNQHDDSDAINAILAANANCKITYFPQGIYKVTKTIHIPPGSRIVGDVFSSISGIGSNFYKPDAPQPIVQVGKSGDVGVAEISDMLFTVADVLQGATILEINMAGNSPGDVSFHNTHIRVGGSADTVVDKNCAGSDTSDCKAAFAQLHVTSSAQPYIENMWGWTADHSLDGGPNQNIATGRGALIESTKGAWLVGTAFEHNTLYQYNLNNAQNVYIGMQQTETAYWQGYGTSEQAPSPWTPVSSIGDPNFNNCGSSGDSGNAQCYMGFAQHFSSSSNIVIHGSAFWVFFNDMTDGSYSNAGCPNHNNICQENAVIMTGTSNLFWYNLLTKSTANMIRDGGKVTATQSSNPGGWEGSSPGIIAAYLKDSGVAAAQ